MSDDLTLEQAVDSVFAEQDASVTPEPTPSPEPEVAAATPETPTVEATEPPATPDPAPPTPAALADDTIVEVLVDGQPQPMKWSDARKGVMMHAAFTKKTQTLAEERKQVAQYKEAAQAEIQKATQLQQQVMQILQDPAKLSAVYLAMQSQQRGQPLQPQAPQAPQFDPLQFKQQIVSEALQTIHAKQQEAAVESDVTTFTTGLIADDPILSIVPGFIDRVYEDVAKMGPTTTAEAKEYIRLYIEDTKTKLTGVSAQTAKAAAATKAKVIANGTIPGGAPVTPAAKDYASFNDMESDILAFLK